MRELSINNNSKLFALLLNIYNPKENFEITKNYFKSENPSDLIHSAQKTDCDILALRFNVLSLDELPKAVSLLRDLLPYITKQLMICGTGKKEIDEKLLPELVKVLDREQCIISFATENTYKSILPSVMAGNHYVVLKTPIDINLAKELNILSVDMGLSLDKIIMNTDIGGLGYGYEYGYSMMEKVKLESPKDDYLSFPIISDASVESLKTKEARFDNFPNSWGELLKRAEMIELSSCAGAIAAGANIVVVNNPDSIKFLRELV